MYGCYCLFIDGKLSRGGVKSKLCIRLLSQRRSDATTFDSERCTT